MTLTPLVPWLPVDLVYQLLMTDENGEIEFLRTTRRYNPDDRTLHAPL
jgi:hypothetical protein